MTLLSFLAIITLLVAIGQFLDSQFVEIATKERTRLYLVRLYVWLYEAPGKVQKRVSDYRDRGYEARRPENTFIEKYIYGRRYWLVIVPALTIILGLFFQYIFKETPDFPRRIAWWWSFFFGFFIAMVLPLLLATLLTFIYVILFLPALFMVLVIEIIRRFLLLTFDKSSNPRTSPFSYFTGLLAVILGLFTAIERIFFESGVTVH
jgi:hypothetical protein